MSILPHQEWWSTGFDALNNVGIVFVRGIHSYHWQSPTRSKPGISRQSAITSPSSLPVTTSTSDIVATICCHWFTKWSFNQWVIHPWTSKHKAFSKPAAIRNDTDGHNLDQQKGSSHDNLWNCSCTLVEILLEFSASYSIPICPLNLLWAPILSGILDHNEIEKAARGVSMEFLAAQGSVLWCRLHKHHCAIMMPL